MRAELFPKKNPQVAIKLEQLWRPHVSETLGYISEEVHVNLQPRGPHGVPPSFHRYADSLQSITYGTMGPCRMPPGQRAP